MRAVCFWMLCLSSCGSRSALPELESGDGSSPGADATAFVDAAPPDAPLPPGCFGAGETLLAADGQPTAIAIDSTYVYWAIAGIECGDGEIRRTPKSGGATVTLAKSQPSPRAIAVDQDRVYFYNGCGSGLLRSVPKQGGSVFDHPIAVDPFTDARVLAVDSQNIYFNSYGVLSIPKNGGAQQVIDDHDYVYALAADDAGVFWIGPIGGGPSYGVFSYHPGDAGSTLLAQPDTVGSGVAVDQKDVYFAGGIGIQRMARNGGPLSTVVAANPYKIALDESFVYWTEGYSGSGGHSVKKVAKSGGAEVVIATGDGAYLEIAVDERCVYWADLYGSRVMRAPK